jgi:DNA-binding transcriptional LysR family regulator
VRDEIGRGRLRRLRVAGLRLRRPIFLVRHRDKRDSPVMRAFLEVVEGTFGPPRA